MSELLEIERIRARILGFLALMDDLPPETAEALRRDQEHRQRLLAELEALENQSCINRLVALRPAENHLNCLIKPR